MQTEAKRRALDEITTRQKAADRMPNCRSNLQRLLKSSRFNSSLPLHYPAAAVSLPRRMQHRPAGTARPERRQHLSRRCREAGRKGVSQASAGRASIKAAETGDQRGGARGEI